MIQHVAIELREEDAESCAAFWELLGFARVQPPPSLAARAAWLEADGVQIHLLFAAAPVVAPEGHIALVVDDYEATLAVLREAGFEPQPRSRHWGSPRAFVRSPAGHRVELMAFAPGSES